MDFLSSELPQGLHSQQNRSFFIFDKYNLGFCVLNVENADFLSLVLLGKLPQDLFVFQQDKSFVIADK
jgi:hypothetical protein